MKTLSEQTLKHRFWLSDQWLDTEVGKDKNIKMLEYACGPGVISMVSHKTRDLAIISLTTDGIIELTLDFMVDARALCLSSYRI